MIKLVYLVNLIETPDLHGVPNLERLTIIGCRQLKKIHPSIGGLERLLYLKVSYCDNLKKFPPFTRSHKLSTFKITHCENVESLLMETYLPRIRSQVCHTATTNLTLRDCNLGDGDIDSIVWDLPYLQELHLGDNDFSWFDFSLLRLPRLKFLDVSHCKMLVELSGLPSSIAVFKANNCFSLQSVGDITNLKWLWNVSLLGKNKLDQLRGNILLRHIMLKGNSIEHHFINFCTDSVDHIPRGLVDRLVCVNAYRMKLPENWYNHFSGFLICVADRYHSNNPRIEISITKEAEKEDVMANFINEVCQESIKAPDWGLRAYVGYVPFNSLKRDIPTCFNSSFNTISISQRDTKYEKWLVGDMVPRKSNADQTTADSSSQFYDKEDKFGRKTFMIQHQSNFSINITRSPVTVSVGKY